LRTTIDVRGARENNLQNIDVEIPRDKLVVVTGLSGSGKSSLAFETVYAEGQRRFLESLSSFAKRFISQLKKPDVDFVYGLSPVVSIEQKTTGNNPRSTVGTMTDISNYLQLLYATVGDAHCPYCHDPIPMRSAHRIVEHILALPIGTEIELRAPAWKLFGEDYPYLLGEIRNNSYRRLYIDGELTDISEDVELDEDTDYDMEVLIDKFVVRPEIDKNLLVSVEAALTMGEGYLRVHIPEAEDAAEDGASDSKIDLDAFHADFSCPEHRVTMGEPSPTYFQFNNPTAACRTCSGLGTYLQVHPDLLVPDKSRSILDGAFVRQAYKYDRDTWDGHIMYSMSKQYGFGLDVPFSDLPKKVVDLLLNGTKGKKIKMVIPPDAKRGHRREGREFKFDGIINRIDRHYRWYRRKQEANTHMEEYLRKVMVEHVCPECEGTRLKPTHTETLIHGENIHEAGEKHLSELRDFLAAIELPERHAEAGGQILKEVGARLDVLIGIGLDYLNMNRRSGTLSGGESQRIRLSTQIGSGLMGMLYVLDEPSIGLHPKDNVKMIETLRQLRDIGNTVIVVEHDEETIRAADHILELGPGPGIHGGEIVAEGTLDDILEHPASLTGQFLSGRKQIDMPETRREANGKRLIIRGARANNLKDLDIEFPLGVFICITGASGSGKSSLINEILYKKLYALHYDSRVLSGDHDAVEGHEYVTDVINIDQSPIGRTPRSNPATYIGIYDKIRQIYASTEESVERGYKPGRFSFNVKGGRCEECAGDGSIKTAMHFMPDVEGTCPSCKGARYNEDTLEVQYEGKNISEVLDLSLEDAEQFFEDTSIIARKVGVLNDLGLGYLKLGQSSTTLSGGEAQRVKLATELGKVKRGAHKLYILDEPTTGLHAADIQRLLDSLNRLVNAGNTVIVIEHHLDVIKTAGHVIDLGPEGGHSGGELLACGTPEEIAAEERSHTGRYLRPHL